jgi:replication factor C small subunit
MQHTLWTEKYRSQTLDQYIGNNELKTTIHSWITKNDIPHLLLHGKAGTGKTTLAKLITQNINCDMMYINASDENGIDTIRDKVKSFASTSTFQPLKVVILDESDYLTINAQASLRNIIETFSAKTRFILTCNYVERIIEPLQSRCQAFKIETLSKPLIAAHIADILTAENVTYHLKDVARIINEYHPDIRKIINVTQQNTINGELILTKINTKFDITDVVKLIQGKDAFKSVRQYLVDNNISDFEPMYRALYDELGKDNGLITMTLAEYQFKHSTVTDKEINFMAMIASIINQLNNENTD